MAFVDAFLPPAHGTARLVPLEFVEDLSALASDDVLPPWSTWFGEGVMRDLVPDDTRRARVEQDMPRLSLSFLQIEVPVPDGWDRRHRAARRPAAGARSPDHSGGGGGHAHPALC